MPELSIDIETFSSVDLKGGTVYTYSEAPDFQILLFSYAVNDDLVQCIDLTRRELPGNVIDMLLDPSFTKTAYNANFERVCLSRYLGRHLSPENWRCTMVHASTLGLPRTLADVGRVLGLPEDKQKMKEGRALIDYFCKPCKPTKKNGGRLRNFPEHDVEKWETFKAYNIRDVETERAIRRRLEQYPMPPEELDAYWLDQDINDRGVLVDREIVAAAIQMNMAHRAEITREAVEISGLQNVNSVAQLKNWLLNNGVKLQDSLDKKAIAELRKTGDLSAAADRMLAIRQELGKSSVSKYEAMQRGMCADGRARGLFAFYGASRTGRWCLTGDHEVLTDEGWKKLYDWQGGKIACWNPDGEIVSFQDSKALSFYYDGPMYTYEDKRIAQVSTPDHRMYVKRRYDGAWQTDTVEHMQHYRPSIPMTGYRERRPGMEHEKLRVLVMTQADGHFTDDGGLRFAFKKERKIERCKSLLRAASILFIERTYDDRTVIVICSRHVPLWLRMFQSKTFGMWLLDESPDVFFDELVYWDGYRASANSIQYVTCNRQNADMVQAFAHITGRCAVLKIKKRSNEHPNWRDAYYVDVWLRPINCHEIRSKPTLQAYKGGVYCAETPTGYFIVRREGRVWVTGNSGRQIQVQNLPQNHLPDLEVAREIVREGDSESLKSLFGSVPAVLSELIRTAFVAKPGHTFVVADFSAIEARVVAWLADEQWRQDVFAQGGDIYCASASQMFHVPVVKHGVNGHLRQKGKIAELALGYGGSVGALKAMGALEMGLQEEELKPLVDAWRKANPAVVALWWQIDRAARDTIRRRGSWRYDLPHGLSMMCSEKLLHIRLPSGRNLRYWQPRLEWDESLGIGRENITYGSTEAGAWTRVETYGPKLMENIVQATARDCLRDAMLRVAIRYPGIVMHIHDEMVVEVPKEAAHVALQDMLGIMADPVPWAPGLLLKGDGYITDFYRKD